jgi:hypothetical protein
VPGSGGGGSTNFTPHPSALSFNTNSLWLRVPTNALPGSGLFNVVIHNTTQGSPYDVLTKVNLLSPSWTVETTVTGASGNSTYATLDQDGRTNLFVWARTSVIPIYMQPLAQEVWDGDTVTFAVTAGGAGLMYQWTFDGTNIFGATGSSFTINNAQAANMGNYAVVITGSGGTVTSVAATLAVDNVSHGTGEMGIVGQRQNYTFRSGQTYTIGSTIALYGQTTIQGGSVIKFDTTQPYPTLLVMGSLACNGGEYDPAYLTSIDDNSIGIAYNTNTPQLVVTGVPYLDLSDAGSLSISNLYFRFADEAVSTPSSGRLDMWDCQFFQCNGAVINEYGGTNAFHNVLLAECVDAVAASTNSFSVSAEHLTASVSNLWDSLILPTSVALTNSIILGHIGTATSYFTQNIAVNPAVTNFQASGAGDFYLASGSSLRQAGTTNVSPHLLAEFHNKTTCVPMALPSLMNLSGNLTMFPQTPRYTNGAPDLGYYYDALDYTVAGLTNFGTITIEPGTAIGMREDTNVVSLWGFRLREASSLVSHGTPTRPNIFVDVQRVQEQTTTPCYGLIVPDYESGDTNVPGPIMDFRFCNFYAAVSWYHIWAGNRETSDYLASFDSVVNWTMQDCNFHGGKISLGTPDNGNFYGIPYTTYYGSGAVTWNNNLFDNVLVNLVPSFNWYDGTINVNLALQARNNLFRNGGQFILAPVVTSAGNWTFTDNLFDLAEFDQLAGLPLIFDYNGYWPLPSPYYSGDTTQLQSTGGTNGLHEVALSYAPPYSSGPFGNYYISTLTPLYEAGSQPAGNAGLAQYTTSTNEVKEVAANPVSIGLHYVAATNNVPLDSDGDGIPDYVEDANGNGIVDANETDPHNAMTDGINPDASNSVYLDIDLSGDGLVGRVKSALGINPLNPNNPLALKQIITGQEPDIATFEVPISYAVLTNAGNLNLCLEGLSARLQDVKQAADGNCELVWNTDYETPGQHSLQAEFLINGAADELRQSVGAGFGSLTGFNSANVVQFFEQTSAFDSSGAVLYAHTPTCPNANYTIELRDPNNPSSPHIKTFTGSTSSGVIQTNWDLTYDDGVTVFTNQAVDVVYSVTLLDPGNGTNTQRLNQTPGVNTTGQFDFAYTLNPSPILQQYGDYWNQMQSACDTLLMPVTSGGGHSDNYVSYFNVYTSENFPGQPGFPGYLSSRSVATNLLFYLSQSFTANCYISGHGNSTYITDGQTNSTGHYSGAYIGAGEVATMLTNSWTAAGGPNAKHPYRFVFLDGCDTAQTMTWAHAFGIYDKGTNGLPQTIIGPQAFVGWQGLKASIADANGVNDTLANAYGATINRFYLDWINGRPLAVCEADAENNILPFPLPVPGNENTSLLSGAPTSKLITIGYFGLTRGGVDPSYP